MSEMVKRVSIGVAVVVLSTLILWLASHALKAETHMAADEVESVAFQRQLDRIEEKVDWLIEMEINGKKD
jgi:sensor domain CHASE-containing protein